MVNEELIIDGQRGALDWPWPLLIDNEVKALGCTPVRITEVNAHLQLPSSLVSYLLLHIALCQRYHKRPPVEDIFGWLSLILVLFVEYNHLLPDARPLRSPLMAWTISFSQ
ncbi:uncharacterized protein LY89DRAFT_788443 [Mollisia scopiformis]|uniref:Uncharacterized protein n=1 Tax=Mollisia scopiformis TaxID=149040 RepID=A0A132B9E7_MOLSC|nr:uncharacterized protein LY89DRAFT_788443 [Mollisia scopiformis]KUJ09028.1 hypothetical protein LY89DRAFT_788443 [Mollisia scopiformis]